MKNVVQQSDIIFFDTHTHTFTVIGNLSSYKRGKNVVDAVQKIDYEIPSWIIIANFNVTLC